MNIPHNATAVVEITGAPVAALASMTDPTIHGIKAMFLRPETVLAAVKQLDRQKHWKLLNELLTVLEDKTGYIPIISIYVDALLEDLQEDHQEGDMPTIPSREQLIHIARDVAGFDWGYHYDTIHNEMLDQVRRAQGEPKDTAP